MRRRRLAQACALGGWLASLTLLPSTGSGAAGGGGAGSVVGPGVGGGVDPAGGSEWGGPSL